MEQPKLKDLRISGVGKASGGVYGNVTTDGIATLNGDISCSALTASGTLKVKGGSLEAGRFRLNGNGSGTCGMSGGDFRLDGILKLSGDVKFTTLTINGMLQAGGSSSGERAEINGGMKLGGSAEFEEMDIHGHIQVAGMLNAGQISLSLAGPASRVKDISGELRVVKSRLNGDIRIGEGISGDNIQITGKCTVRRGCQAEHFRVKGAVQTEGTINADQVELWLLGPARAAEIVGGRISVAPQISWGLMPWQKSWGTPELQANVIEGDVIRLENTVCGVVRGGDVTIGPGCRIGLVEYTKQYHQDSHSEVKECLKGGGSDHE